MTRRKVGSVRQRKHEPIDHLDPTDPGVVSANPDGTATLRPSTAAGSVSQPPDGTIQASKPTTRAGKALLETGLIGDYKGWIEVDYPEMEEIILAIEAEVRQQERERAYRDGYRAGTDDTLIYLPGDRDRRADADFAAADYARVMARGEIGVEAEPKYPGKPTNSAI